MGGTFWLQCFLASGGSLAPNRPNVVLVLLESHPTGGVALLGPRVFGILVG